MGLIIAVCPYCHIGLTLDEWNKHAHVSPAAAEAEEVEDEPEVVEDDQPRPIAPGWRRRKDGTRYWVDTSLRGKPRQEEQEQINE